MLLAVTGTAALDVCSRADYASLASGARSITQAPKECGMPGDDLAPQGDPLRADGLRADGLEADEFAVSSLVAARSQRQDIRRLRHDSPEMARLDALGRLRRVVVAAGVVLLALLVLVGPTLSVALLGAIATARDHLQAALTPRLPAVATFAATPRAIPAPLGSVGNGAISVSPAALSPDVAYACWPRPGEQPGGSGLELAYTTNGGLGWQSLAPPSAAGAAGACTVQADALSTTTVLLIVEHPGAAGLGCAVPDLYLLRVGGSWRPIPLPAALAPTCNVHLMLAAPAVYFWADSPIVAPSAESRGLPIWSPDLGASWHTDLAGLGGYSAFTLLGIRPGGLLLAQATRAAPQSGDAMLESLDSGDSWAERGVLPGNHLIVAPPGLGETPGDGASGGGVWGRLYATSAEVVSRPSDPMQYQLWTASAPTGPWHRLPAVPVTHPGSGAGGQDAVMLTLGAGPRGGLLVALPSPASNDPNSSGNVPPRELWLWDPTQSAWLLCEHLVPHDAFFDGIAWQGDAPTVWVSLIRLDVPKVELYTMTLG
jgi:hypothetical protein